MKRDVRVDVHVTAEDLAAELRADVRAGLAAPPRVLPAKWFYDAEGSVLFERITRLPEYYPTRAEREILTARAPAIAAATGAKTLVELGSGSAEKTRLLLAALTSAGTLARYVPFDVSADALRAASRSIAAGHPGLEVHGLAADFTRHLRFIPAGGGRLVAFLGGTLGNLLPAERAEFFAGLRSILEPGEWLLVGADLVKDEGRLVAAYDDAEGVTAAFNRNILRVLNRELGADFDPGAFAHVARWDPGREWIEMALRAEREQRVALPGAGLSIRFAAGEELRTEVSAKFRRDGLTGELLTAGFAVRDWWTDAGDRFALALARAE